ncbi:ABC transporter substrate-binding protein [Lysinibacillus sp. KCTC 33748]|uniref:ABC transporter substrate-binding protein n=1 Tax=unclassified Lysinibacillus TaxID=2636778 RepID=UPI0009A8C476|nr:MULTISPECIES: ABC transporter substrate-binding protein [unclassified Lysinibacillus]OXS68632.1 ABC transporter substrate-binding protein [Lysinibacillus sp. KCTC 33748]SKC09605.1 iron complex transport system substrate-binding protein [Lysinibacillus sp. AC-3]
MKKYGYLATLALTAMLAACGSQDGGSSSNQSAESSKAEVQSTVEEKIVTDQLGREVTVPGKIDRVVTGGILPYFSTWYVATNSTKEIVGMHPNSYNAAKNSILAKISPDVLKAETSFIQNGEVNVEELMKVNPQLYVEISTNEDSINKISEAGIPVVAVKAIDAAAAEPLATFNSWLKLTSQMTGTTDRADRFLDEGKKVQSELDAKLKDVATQDKPRAMILHMHNDKSITVGGKNFFGNQWLNATGAVDVAENDVQGKKEVNMEQIYAWNPDIIYITNFTETQPEDLLKNKVDGQDWSQVKAVQEGKVYKIPLGIYRWFPPSGDAPLMLKWLAQKNHPTLFNYKIEDEIKTYYKDFYEFDVSDEEVHSILNPSSDAAKY